MKGKKLMFLSEWREFPSAPCLAEKKRLDDIASRCCWNSVRPWHASQLVSFLVGLRTYQHPSITHRSTFISLSNKINSFFTIYLQESFPSCSAHLYILLKNFLFISFCNFMIATGMFGSTEFYELLAHIFLALPTSSCSWEYTETPTATQGL